MSSEDLTSRLASVIIYRVYHRDTSLNTKTRNGENEGSKGRKRRKRREKKRKEETNKGKRQVKPNMAVAFSLYSSRRPEKRVSRASGSGPKARAYSMPVISRNALVYALYLRSLYSRIARDGWEDLRRARESSKRRGHGVARGALRLGSTRLDSAAHLRNARARDAVFV